MSQTKPYNVSELFLIPMSGLFADPDVGVGLVHLQDDFEQIEPDSRLMILADWQRQFAKLHAAAFDDLYGQILERTEGLPNDQRLAALREKCAEIGQAWPAELGVRIARDLL